MRSEPPCHTILHVGDLERSAGFYRDVLGWRQFLPEPDAEPSPVRFAAFMAPLGRSHHELVLIEADREERGRVGGHRIALRVGDTEEELHQALISLAEHDLAVLGSADRPGVRSAWVRDPDGNEVELFVVDDRPRESVRSAEPARARVVERPPASAEPISAPDRPTVLFLMGIERRSGTNYLYDLLVRHQDIAIRPPLWEDYLLDRLGPLADFATDLTGLWRAYWRMGKAEAERFLRLQGEALESFLVERSTDPYVLVKTPTANNLDLASLFFPRSPVVLLVRDGRAVCESASLTFGDTMAHTARSWARNGRRILDFLDNGDRTAPAVLVRYEDLVTDLEAQMTRLLTALGLDVGRYDFADARELPVRGSSTLRGDKDEVHWRGVPRAPDFDPLARYRHWTTGQLREFEALAADVLTAFGYPVLAGTEDPSIVRTSHQRTV